MHSNPMGSAIVVGWRRLARLAEFLIVRAASYNDLCGYISFLDEETLPVLPRHVPRLIDR
jgi:hypothetical protein